MCDCNGSIPTISQRTIDPCAAVTIPVLNLYLSLVDCMLADGRYTVAKTTESETLAAKDKIQAWISEKEIDPASCAYYQFLPVMQDLVKRIMLSNICNDL